MDQLIQIVVTGVSQGAIYTLIGLGFAIVMMATKCLNMANGSYVLYGAFIFLTFSSALKIPPLAVVPMVLVVVMTIGVITDRILNVGSSPWRQVSSHLTILRTLALMVVFEGLAFVIWGPDPRRPPALAPGVLNVGGAILSWQSVWMMVAAVALTLGFSLFLHRTWLGLAMRASAENPVTGWLLGVDRRMIGLLAFAIAAGIGSLSGILISPVTWVDYSAAGFFLLKGLIVYLIGGEDNVAGSLVGGILLGLTENSLLLVPGMAGGFLKTVVPLIVLILVLLLRPQGLLAPRQARAV
jgi:branched-chain amino acid transport system permease protein